jgi:acetate kinase
MAEILCLNAGSSSLKFALYAEPGTDEPSLLASGKIENIGLEPHLIARDAKGMSLPSGAGRKTARSRTRRCSRICCGRSKPRSATI